MLIKLYRCTISPFLGNHCRFSPSCSCYADEAFQQYSFIQALFLSAKRILKCHPFSEGGYNPLPARRSPGKFT